MRFGFFDDERREYVIERPDTPLPWINYLGSQDFFGLISNTAGGYTFYRDARLRRLTRYRYNNVPLDSGGRYLYLRDDQSAQYWSPTWQPTQTDLDFYECRHGLGYTKIRSKLNEIETSICYFIPLNETLEVWQVQIENQRPEPAEISLFSCVEFCLWDAWDDMTNYQRNYNLAEVEAQDGVIYHKTEYRERRSHFAYLACSDPVSGFDTQRLDFLGPYRSFANPTVVENGRCSNSIAHGWAPVGVQHLKLDIEPGGKRNLIFLLGYHENPPAEKFDPPGSQTINKKYVLPTIQHFLDAGNVKQAFDELNSYWGTLLGKLQVNTPDVHTNRMVNIWNAYQCMVTFNMSRSASYFESGIGRGMGFRDSNQDLLGFVHMIPERARARILDLAATQLHSGGAYHQYQPLTRRGNDAVGSNFNDDPLWLVLAVAAYLKESGDWDILDELVPFENQPGSEASLYTHLQKCLEYTLARLGAHELPLIGRADWNDCLNLNAFSESPGESFQTTTNREGKVAESVFIAGLFVLAADEMQAISRCTKRSQEAIEYQRAADRMKAVILESGWDGDWFLRAYDNEGHKIGSHENQEGQIFIEPQGICVMAGIGLEDGKAASALEAVHLRLATLHGIVLLEPAFSKYYLHLGEISTYPPGYKENAGIFCHTNPWIMIAEARLGNNQRAFDDYQCINPSVREAISEIHRCEPYVYAQMIAGKDAATHGEAKNSWLTGTAAWNYIAITEWILGIRPAYNGLQINPVIPESWRGYTAVRVFRGVHYYISVKRIGLGNQVSIKVDRKPVEGDLIALPPAGTDSVEVEVLLS